MQIILWRWSWKSWEMSLLLLTFFSIFKIYKENNLCKKEQCSNTCINIWSIQPYLRGPKDFWQGKGRMSNPKSCFGSWIPAVLKQISRTLGESKSSSRFYGLFPFFSLKLQLWDPQTDQFRGRHWVICASELQTTLLQPETGPSGHMGCI